MPKIKDLGINIIPGTMRPPAIGGGGGCGASCNQGTQQWQDTDPACSCITACNPCQDTVDQGGDGSETDAECPTAEAGCCANGTMRWLDTDDPAICVTAAPCNPCQDGTLCMGTAAGFLAQGGAAQVQGKWDWGTDFECPTAEGPNCVCQIMTCNLPSDCGCTMTGGQDLPHTHPACGCRTHCDAGTQCPVMSHCPTQSVTVTPQTPKLPAGKLSREDIAIIKAELRKYLENVDIAEKALLPKTIEGIDAREKVLQAELEQLRARRDELKKP